MQLRIPRTSGPGSSMSCSDHGVYHSPRLHDGYGLEDGAGLFPTILSVLLVLIGIISLIRSFARQGSPVDRFTVKGLAVVLGGHDPVRAAAPGRRTDHCAADSRGRQCGGQQPVPLASVAPSGSRAHARLHAGLPQGTRRADPDGGIVVREIALATSTAGSAPYS